FEVAAPFARMSYADAMLKYGSDKPDLRPGMEISDLLSVVQTPPDFLKEVAEDSRALRGFIVKGGAKWSRKQLDDLVAEVATVTSGRLAWARRTADGINSSATKAYGADQLEACLAHAGAGADDLLLFMGGHIDTVPTA